MAAGRATGSAAVGVYIAAAGSELVDAARPLSGGFGAARDVLWILCALHAAYTLWAAARRSQQASRTVWRGLAAAVATWAAGDVLWLATAWAGATPPLLGPIDAVYLCGYPLLFGALWVMSRSRDAVARSGAAVDALAVTGGCAFLLWQCFVEAGGPAEGGAAGRLAASLYPMMDVFVLAALVGVLFAPGRRTTAVWALTGFAAATLVGDLVFSSSVRLGEGVKGYADPLFVLGYGLAAWAARSPSATSIAKAGPADEAGWLRRTAVGLSVFFPAVTGAALLSVGNRINLAMYLTVTILIGVLVAVRVAALVHRVSRSRAELHALVRRDSLTGLRNRTALLEDAERLLAGLDTLDTPENGAAFAVLLVDLDRFKIVNDSLGHGAGDHLLGLAAARLQAVAGDEARVYRLGGDEFVVLAEGLRGEHQALEAGHRLVRELSRVYELDGVEAWISASVGISFAEPRSDAAGLLRDADLAMYQVKRAGRDGVHVFDRAMRDEVRARQSLESELRRAVEAAAVEVAYQPYVELASGRLVGFEALARIASGGGQLDAAAFIGVAEQIGLVGRIGELVLADAASQAARWNRGRRGPAVRVSVNLSTQQLLDPRLVARVAAALAEAGCRPEWVTLELTETSLVADPPAAASRLAELHALGVRLAIDDFGAGYSSLAYLREFPVDQLKVDQQFVRDLGASPSARSLAGSMVALAHGLGLEVIGEGVERAEQAAALLELGCEHGQGYLYGPPLDAGWAAARARSAGRGDVEPAALTASHAGAPR